MGNGKAVMRVTFVPNIAPDSAVAGASGLDKWSEEDAGSPGFSRHLPASDH
jgi:hypothetical protein